MASESGGGVDVAGGDPGQIAAAAAWHQELANALELHYGTIHNATAGVLSTWNGEAASAYGQLSQYVENHFVWTAQNAQTMGNILQKYSDELAAWQNQGRNAMHQAEYWLQQQNTWQTKLDQANTAVTNAESWVSSAQQDLANAQNASSNPLFSGPLMPAHNVGAAANELQQAQAALTQALKDQAQAVKQLRHAGDEVMHWQQKGRQLWLEATNAGMELCGKVGRLPIAPPPLAGWARSDQYTQAMAPHQGSGGIVGTILGVVQDAADVVAAAGGVCAATMFWNPVGEVCGGASTIASGVSTADGWLQAATGDGSVEGALLDTAGLGASKYATALGKTGDALLEAASKSGDLTRGDLGWLSKAVGGQVNGASGLASAGELASSASHHGGH
jgi:hypothetical protein